MDVYAPRSDHFTTLRIAASNMLWASRTWWWRVLPKDHPAAIYMTGRDDAAGEGLHDAISHRDCRLRKIALAIALLLTWFVLDAAAHRLHLNPAESMFDWI